MAKSKPTIYRQQTSSPPDQGRFQGDAAPSKISAPLYAPPKKFKIRPPLSKITYLIVQRESISCVPPDESVATPVAPKWKPQNRHCTRSTLQKS